MDVTDDREHARTVLLCEFQQLRTEINNRTQLSAGLVALQLTTIAGSLAILEKLPDVVLGLAIVSSFLWLLWLDHTSQIYKVAAYVGLRLAPRLCEQDTGLLGWETFLRDLDQDSRHAAKALFGDSSSRGSVSMLRTEVIGRFISLLFGALPPLLVAGFVIAKHDELSNWDSLLSLRGAILVLAIAASLYSWRQYFVFVRMRESIDRALMDAGETRAAEAVRQAGPSQ